MPSDLAALLDDLAAGDPAAARARAAAAALLATPAPFDRAQTDPGHFTASALVVAPARDAVLLIHHRTFDLWIQPGGHFDPSDRSVEEAARREVLEETGLAALVPMPGAPLLLDLDVHDIPANLRRGEGPHRHYDLRLLFLATDAALRPSAEVGGARWVPFDALHALATDDSVRRAVARARARLPSPETT
jgi:8-oxo-dGTP pyrophosphatase MutT (NUDIX family)